ncbi:transcription factor IIIB 70 kDa subunit-like isoform X1, partial [Olea europaea subsp. europaea]
ERQQKRAAELKNSVPAQTAAEATRQMLTKKRLSSKINYDVLDKLFDESVISEDAKKSRTDLDSCNDDKPVQHRERDLEKEDNYNEKEPLDRENMVVLKTSDRQLLAALLLLLFVVFSAAVRTSRAKNGHGNFRLLRNWSKP